MLSPEVVRELRESWLPNASPAGLDRVIDLLEKGSPLLLAGRFTETLPRGCLATHIGWHHPAVCHRTIDAGILWLTRVAGLNPATSAVIREWDRRNPQDWTFRSELLAVLKEARAEVESAAPVGEPVGV
ncbi:MAG TPA: hypothetical protein VH120_21770 [Gemmataceae bacterium]|jgi:hypothetical protein|nr:hypothetical protein [Gemmataceae bacterium]